MIHILGLCKLNPITLLNILNLPYKLASRYEKNDCAILRRNTMSGEVYDIIVIGGGFTGLTVAHHLSKLGLTCVVLDEKGIGGGEYSGTRGPSRPPHSKMLTSVPEDKYDTIFKKHTRNDAITYIEFMKAGVAELKAVTAEFSKNPIRELGSLTLARDERQWKKLQKDHEKYKSVSGEDLVSYSPQKIASLFGTNADMFKGGYFRQCDAIVNPILYRDQLIENAKDRIVPVEGWRVAELVEENNCVTVVAAEQYRSSDISNGTVVRGTHRYLAKYVVVATNSFVDDVILPGFSSSLRGIIKPHWSFVQCYECEGVNTPNAWTFEEKYYYFTRQDNILLVGGEESEAISKYSNEEDGSIRRKLSIGKKGNKSKEEIARKNIKEWTRKNFPKAGECVDEYHGIYGQVDDNLPIVGKIDPKSRITYALGCNGIGFTTLSLGAALMPGILGLAELTNEQKGFAELVSPNRPSLQISGYETKHNAEN
jgi:glycine/D-amino acid oxidase-like deaminating enzyme